MVYAFGEALRMFLKEGREAGWTRHMRNGQGLKAGLAALGIPLASVEGHQLPQLHAARIPAGVDDVATRKRLLAEFGIEIGGWVGAVKGKRLRIGLLGAKSPPNYVL